MKAKRFVIGVVFFLALAFVVGFVTARRIEESGFDKFQGENTELSWEEELARNTSISFPHLPEETNVLETTPDSIPTTTAETTPSEPHLTLLEVPFTSQAPTGKWVDARFQDGCEEASSLMAIRWVQGKSLTSQEAEKEILAISAYEQKVYGGYQDTSAQDTVERIFKGYFEYPNVTVRHGITVEDIHQELEKGNLVIVPVDGRELGNPYYTPPGPERHNLLIIGYDPATDEFITNNPGTRRGKGYRYSSGVLGSALLDYPTGNHNPATPGKTAMIVVGKDK